MCGRYEFVLSLVQYAQRGYFKETMQLEKLLIHSVSDLGQLG
jgi:hypothetical protein